jgi:hypothetical protein
VLRLIRECLLFQMIASINYFYAALLLYKYHYRILLVVLPGGPTFLLSRTTCPIIYRKIRDLAQFIILPLQ